MFKVAFFISFLGLFFSIFLSIPSVTNASEGDWRININLDSYLWGQGTNGQNSISYGSLNADFRPALDFSYQDTLKFVVQPRSQLQEIWQNPPFSDPEYNHINSITQGYVLAHLGDNVMVVVGVQNYQWGPTEVISPSDPLIHFVPGQRSILWLEQGRGLARINITLSPQVNLVFIGNIFNNDLTPANSGGTFTQLGLGKIEYEVSPATYFGLTYGNGPSTRAFVGEYGSVEVSEGLTAYLDAREYQGSDAYYPVAEGPLLLLAQTNAQSQSVETLMDVGLRYDGAIDLRGEFIFNSAGYNQNQFQQVLAAENLTSLSPVFSGNSSGFSSGLNSEGIILPGLEFPGQYYGYASLRIPNIGYQKKMNLGLHYLHSFMDQSGLIIFSADQPLTDFISGLVELSNTQGSSGSELTLGGGTTYLLGARFTL
jgi:hypothetical protein